MPKKDTVAIVYAQALLDLAFEKGTHAEVLQDMREVGRALRKDPRSLEFLIAPHIRKDAKKQVVDKVFGGRTSEIVTNFLKVLVDKGRQAELPAIMEQFEEAYHERMGELVVHVRSAVSLEDAERARLKKLLLKKLNKEIVLEERQEPALLGGLVIRVRDSVIDGSIRSRLAAIADRLDRRRIPFEVIQS